MKKNITIISMIFIIPIIAYMILASSTMSYAQKDTIDKAQLLKFSSKLCIDCKKIAKELDSIAPKYEKTIVIQEIDVQKSDKKTNDMIDKYDINLVPTLIYIDKNGRQVRRTEGAIDKKLLEQYLDELANE